MNAYQAQTVNWTSAPINWEVVEYEGNSTSAKSIKRLSDNVVFSIGDVVTNGTKMKGKIKKFDFSFHGNHINVITDWSGIGMSLDSLEHPSLLPSKFQIGEDVMFTVTTETPSVYAIVNGVHFYLNKVKYDLEIQDWESSHRIYNVEEDSIKKR